MGTVQSSSNTAESRRAAKYLCVRTIIICPSRYVSSAWGFCPSTAHRAVHLLEQVRDTSLEGQEGTTDQKGRKSTTHNASIIPNIHCGGYDYVMNKTDRSDGQI